MEHEKTLKISWKKIYSWDKNLLYWAITLKQKSFYECQKIESKCKTTRKITWKIREKFKYYRALLHWAKRLKPDLFYEYLKNASKYEKTLKITKNLKIQKLKKRKDWNHIPIKYTKKKC